MAVVVLCSVDGGDGGGVGGELRERGDEVELRGDEVLSDGEELVEGFRSFLCDVGGCVGGCGCWLRRALLVDRVRRARGSWLLSCDDEWVGVSAGVDVGGFFPEFFVGGCGGDVRASGGLCLGGMLVGKCQSGLVGVVQRAGGGF